MDCERNGAVLRMSPSSNGASFAFTFDSFTNRFCAITDNDSFRNRSTTPRLFVVRSSMRGIRRRRIDVRMRRKDWIRNCSNRRASGRGLSCESSLDRCNVILLVLTFLATIPLLLDFFHEKRNGSRAAFGRLGTRGSVSVSDSDHGTYPN